MKIKHQPLVVQFFLVATGLFIIIYLLAGLIASTASGYYPEIVLMFIPKAWHERRLLDVMFLELLPLWVAIGVISVCYVGYRWNPLGL